MFDISFTELMVIGIIALIVIGPERLPKVARTLGHLMGRAQRYVNDVKSDIQHEIELDELRKFKDEIDHAATDVQSSIGNTENALQSDLNAMRSTLDETARDAGSGLSAMPSSDTDAQRIADRPLPASDALADNPTTKTPSQPGSST